MHKFLQCLLVAAPLGGAVALAALSGGGRSDAADHLEPPGRTNSSIDSTPDLPADIDDIFAFIRGDQLILAMTFAGPHDPAVNFTRPADPLAPGDYDRDVLYKMLISTQPPAYSPEVTIKWRFGPGQKPHQWGIRIEGIPGVNGTIEGSVGTTLEKDGVKVVTGLFDDPFFFDSQGFRETRNTGEIRFTNTRDFFAHQNDTAVIISIPKDRFAGAAMPINVWATTSRFGGNI